MEPLILLLVLIRVNVVTADDNDKSPYPLWHYRPPGSHQCQCGQAVSGAILCFADRVYLRIDYAMVWDSQINKRVAALSRHAYHNYTTISSYLRVYSLTPNNSEELNELMCGRNNRESYLCDKCRPNYGPSAYSPKCSKCGDLPLPSAITLYLTIKLVPIAILFFVIMTFRIDITRGPILGYIYTLLPNTYYSSKGGGYILPNSVE